MTPVLTETQGTAEWLQARCGKPTGSRMADVIARLKKGGESAKRYAYKIEILRERLTGTCAEKYVTADMQRGIDLEPVAKEVYERITGTEIRPCGFFVHPLIEHSGATPDGLIGDDGLIEIKVPRIETHLGYMLAGEAPEEYLPQMQWEMDSAQRQWVDFVSYAPELPAGLDIWIKRVPRDEEHIQILRNEVLLFLDEVEELMRQLKRNQ